MNVHHLNHLLKHHHTNNGDHIMEFALSITAQAKLEYTNQDPEILEIVFRTLKASEINEVAPYVDRSFQK